MDVEEIVALSVKHNVSDLHLCSDSPPRWRRVGRLEPAPFPSPDVDALLKTWLNDEQQGAWWASGQVDFAVTLTGNQRLRASAFKQMKGNSITLRLLPRACPQLSALGGPRAIPELLSHDSGLILVTGATGSGKSTTLAAMVDFLNHQTDGHILTLEDPVEFVYQSERCLIQQREIGLHSPSFAEALRAALREDPDVILLGELRDSETIRLALTLPLKPGIWCWRRCTRAVPLRRLNGWSIRSRRRRKTRCVISLPAACERCWRKDCFPTCRVGASRCMSCW